MASASTTAAATVLVGLLVAGAVARGPQRDTQVSGVSLVKSDDGLPVPEFAGQAQDNDRPSGTNTYTKMAGMNSHIAGAKKGACADGTCQALRCGATKPCGTLGCFGKSATPCDVAALEQACTADPKCAGFNSNGWLKPCVTSSCGATVQKAGACDLYVGSRPAPPPPPPPPPPTPGPPLPPLGPRLRDLAAARKPPLLFGSDFVDACLQPGLCNKTGTYAYLAEAEFNAGNSDFCLVWEVSQPTPANVYDFTCADRMFHFMKQNNQTYAHVNAVMQAHNVAIWSPCCCPKWLTDGYPYSPWSRSSYAYNYTRAQVRGFLQNRIEAVVPRWIRSGVEVRGIFPINEAIANQPYQGRGGWPHTWLTGAEENLFSWAFGNATHNSTDWFGQTFQWVRAAADNAGATKLRLFYNDYGIETPGAKTDAVYRWVTEQKKNGVPIDGVGFQAHLSCDCRDGCNDTSVVAANMRRFIEAGLDVWVTELDVTMSKQCTEQDQAAVYAALLGACLANAPHCDSFMTWGFTDKYTWLPGKSPLMFDEQYQPKPAYFALQKLLASAPPPPLPFCIENNCQGAVEVHYNTPIPEVGCTLSGWASYGCNLTGYCGPPLTVRAKIDGDFATNATANIPRNASADHTIAGDHGFTLKFPPADCAKLQGGSHWVTVEALADGSTWFGLKNEPICTRDMYGPNARKNGSLLKNGSWVNPGNPSCPPKPPPP